MYELPISITVNEISYNIRNKGDYRVIMDCFIALNDYDMEKDFRIITSLLIFYEDLNSFEDIDDLDSDTLKELIQKMFLFFNCGEKSIGAVKNYRLIDWENDSQILASSINKVANTEIRSLPYMHWWTFMGYYLQIGEGVLSSIVSIREKIVKGKKMEKYEKEFMKENPQYFDWEWRSEEQIEDEKLMNELWQG